MPIAALYARVSTRDSQTNDNQLLELRAFAERLGNAVYREYIDHESGSTAERAQFQQLLLDAHQRRFEQELLFWSLDRFSREGVTETLNHLQRLNAAGVPFKSFAEPYRDSTGVFKEALIAILAAIAKQERVRLFERIKAGQARSPKKPSRPKLAPAKLAEVRRLRGEGLSLKKIQLATGVPVATMHKYLTAAAG